MVSLLHELERTQDRSYALAGKLMAALVEARIERNLSPTVGKQIRTGLSQATVHIASGQAQMADVHRALEALAKALDIRADAFGDGSKDPVSGGA